MTASTIPATERARAYVAKMGPAISGQNGHLQTLLAARAIQSFGLTGADGFEIFSEWNQSCQPPWSGTELAHKWNSVDPSRLQFKTDTSPSHRYSPPPPRPKKPEPNPSLIQKVIESAPFKYLGDFTRKGDPINHNLSPAVWLRKIYKKDELLCLAESIYTPETYTLSEWIDFQASGRISLRDYQYIVPNPMVFRYGITTEGKESPRTKTNTGRRTFQIIEIDPPANGQLAKLLTPPDNQAKILAHLAEYRPLVMIVDSGGKSLHGWFRATDQNFEEFLDYAVRLGADPSLKDKSKLVRLPDGTRPPSTKPRALPVTHRWTGHPQDQRVLFFLEGGAA